MRKIEIDPKRLSTGEFEAADTEDGIIEGFDTLLKAFGLEVVIPTQDFGGFVFKIEKRAE